MKEYLVFYKTQTETFPEEGTMIMKANSISEAIRLTEKQVAKREYVKWVRVTKVEEEVR